MRERIKRWVNYTSIGFLCAIILSICLQSTITVAAASATMTFSTESKSVSVGDTFYVVIILDSSNTIGGFEGYISYDSNVAEFVEGGSFVNGGEGLLRVSDLDSVNVSSTKKYSLEFKAKKTGECVFNTSDIPAVYDENGDNLSVSSNTLTVNVTKSESLSKNNKLKKLLTSPGELNQEYTNDINAYKTKIPYDNEMLFISAQTEDESATVTVEGNEGLKVGTNFVHVIVTAASGDKRDIQIEVEREKKDAEEEKETAEIVDGIIAKTDDENHTLLVTNHSYQVAKLPDDSLIPDGYETSEIKIDGQEIPAYITSNDMENQFVLLYLTNDKKETNFYQYDRIEKTVQRYQSDRKHIDKEQSGEDTSLPYVVIILAMALLIVILSISLIYTIQKNKKIRKSQKYRD